MQKLKNCPICNSKAFIKRDEPDGFYMGWSVGCPKYRQNDGIHKKKMAFCNLDSREEAVEKWNRYCEIEKSDFKNAIGVKNDEETWVLGESEDE